MAKHGREYREYRSESRYQEAHARALRVKNVDLIAHVGLTTFLQGTRTLH
jgi:hypothetical protein